MKAENQSMIMTRNENQFLVSTNYWDTEHSKSGLFYLSWNAGAARLLIPDSQKHLIEEMKKAQYAIISRGFWEERNNRDALEVLFEDGSEAPFSIQLCAVQCDRLLPVSDHGGDVSFFAYTRKGMAFQLAEKYRVVETIPYLEPWGSVRVVIHNIIH